VHEFSGGKARMRSVVELSLVGVGA